MLSIKSIFLTATLFLLSFSSFAQPANDECSGATNLGTLPTPGSCVSGLQNGAVTTLNSQTTVGATAAAPYVYTTSCTGGSMTIFALDTWYRFTATGTTVNINITGFPNANVALYTGTCGNLGGIGCTILGAGGSGTLTVQQIQSGQTYYIQVSGNSTTVTDDNFSITVDNDIDCNDCIRGGTITATPAPVNGGYQPGQTVQFCFHVDQYNEQNTNWMHGVQLTYANGWNAGSLVATPGTGITTGSWNYYPTGIGSNANGNWGPGWYFEYNSGPANPLNNLGDNSPGTSASTYTVPLNVWNFCVSLTVSSSCTPGTSLGVTFNTSGDGESGSWTSSGCVDDPPYAFNAVQVCCTAPTMASTAETCTGASDGTATATHGTGVSPWDYSWTNASGTVVGTTNNSTAASNTVSGLAPGTYLVTITDDNGCISTNDVTIAAGVNCTCSISNFTTNIGTCQTNNTFPVTGTVTFTNAPSSGTLNVVVTTGSGTYTQTFNAPFTNGQVYNYNITTPVSDGSASTVEAFFTANTSCSQILNFIAPNACGCSAQIGTFTADIIGVSTNNYVLCYGDIIDIQTNNDFIEPEEATNPPGPTYDPGVSWMVYSCPPTIGINPAAGVDVFTDPCNQGIISDFDLNDLNDLSIINSFPAGTFTNNIVYFVPITIYSLSQNFYSYVNTSVPCYDMGTPYAVQYLPQIVPVPSQNCSAGTASVSLTGGLPAINGSQFSIVGGSITPATASAVTSTASNGGTITIGGLTNGQAFSFQVQDANGCPVTVSGTFTGLQNAGFSYAQTAYCQSASNPSPTITGVAGGTFTSTAGLSINSSSGVINLTGSTPGTYTVTYTTPGPTCQGTSTTTITVNPLPIINVADDAICQGQNVTLSGNGADTYTWTGGITDGVAFAPTSTNTYTVTGTITATGCTNTDLATVTVNILPGVNAGQDQNICDGTSVTLSGSGATTYSWDNSVSNGVSFTPAVGSVTYTVTGTGTGGCTGQDDVTIVVSALPVITADDVSVCPGGTVAVNASGGNTYSWSPTTSLSSGTGASVTFTAGASTAYTVTGTSAQGCSSSDAVSVTVLPAATIDAGNDVTICQGPTVTLSGSGGTSYSWSDGITNGTAFTPASGTTTYTVTGTNASGCTGTDQVDVTINSNPIVNAGIDQAICPGESLTLSGSGATTYSWNNSVSNGVGFSPASTATYTVTGTNASGCTGTDQVIVTIDPIPSVSAGADFTICAGSPATLTGSGASSYSWNNGVLNGVTFFPNATTTYTVTGTSAAGCTNTDQVTINIEALPVVSFSPDVTIGCSPLTVNFTNNSTGSNNCTWTMSDGTVLTGCSTVSNTFEAAGCYDITLTVSSLNNCISSLTSNDLICVEANPIAAFAPSINIVTEYNGLIDFTNLSIGATDYIWTFGDNSGPSSEENPSHDFAGQNQNTWLVTLVASTPLGCADTAYSTIVYQEELIFYVPNTFTPDNDDYNQTFQPVFTAGYDPYDYVLYIFNRWGEVIFESRDSKKGWDGSYGNNGEVELVQDGTYTWKLEFKVTKNDERKMVVGHVNIIR
ncbi:MAG: gliding motility-associated C-terminal domain-containing protein [Flavobacteriia bacterium]